MSDRMGWTDGSFYFLTPEQAEAEKKQGTKPPLNEADDSDENTPRGGGAERALRNWQTKCLSRIKNGKRPLCDFETDDLPCEQISRIAEGLTFLTDAEGVRELFRQQREVQVERLAPTSSVNDSLKEALLAKWRERRARYEEEFGDDLEDA